MAEKEIEELADNRIYELGYHIVSSIPEEKLPAEVTVIKDVLESNGAVFISEEFPKLRHLTYTMTKVIGARHLKFDTAYFGWMKFEMIPASVLAVKKILDLNESILRFIIIKTVRENTLAVAKPPSYRTEEKPIPGIDDKGEKKEAPVKSPVSEAELDKTIDALVVE